MIELKEENRQRRAILAGAGDTRQAAFRTGMQELAGLAKACGLAVAGEVTQNLDTADAATYIGSGKVEEIRGLLYTLEADLVVFNNTLTPSQLVNLSKLLEVEVLDRTSLILNIFADRARTREARMQVDYARLQYMLPRLSGLRSNLSRQGGTGGSMSNKGAGETQIELDRRHIEKQMAELRRGLKEIERSRETQRSKRRNAGIPLAALVGYTNAGKSTLMNALIREYSGDQEREVFAQDMLFATLDTTVRRITPDTHRDFLLSDTVGFINDLPHDLINAFRSTLQEALYADLILEVVDYSDPDYRMHMEVTEKTLRELGAGHIPVVYIMNKSDKRPGTLFPRVQGDKIYMSAGGGAGLPELLKLIDDHLFGGQYEAELLIPYTAAGVEASIRENAQIREIRYEEEGIFLRASLSNELLQRYRAYVQ